MNQPQAIEWTVKFGNMIYEDEVFVILIPDALDRERVLRMHNAAIKLEKPA